MSVQCLGNGRWSVRVRKRSGSRVICRKKVISGSRSDALRAEVALIDELESLEASSLKLSTFGDALAYFEAHTEEDLSKWRTYADRLRRDLGAVRLDDLCDRFAMYWRLLRNERAARTGELLSTVTRNHILDLSKRALNLCVVRGLIRSNPLSPFRKLPEEARDRILSEDEDARLLDVLQRRESYLYWPVYFSRRNPIRRGDLFSLTRENLDEFRPWIHFYASKTRKRRNRETCLPFLDEPLMQYFRGLPADCPYLFPRIDAKGNWHKVGEIKKHWGAILQEARIRDFRFHDLKHCAITWMLDNGYTSLDLENLGIQYTEAMIKRYYKTSAEKVLRKWRGTCGTKVPQGFAVSR